MAAYNYGEGAIDNAIESSGYSDFWKLREGGFLPQETSNYVPRILAVSAIAKQPEAYGVYVQSEPVLGYKVVNVNKSAKLSDIARLFNISETILSSLNPQLIAGAIPPDGYEIRVPKGIESTVTSEVAQQ